MAGGSSRVQSVFLIDVSALKDTKAKWDEEISLCILRVLSFLNCQVSASDQEKRPKKYHLKWGYKFFSTRGQSNWDLSSAVRFRDFKMRYFEDFEREFKKVLSESKTMLKPEPRSANYPARCLAKTLTEVIHDFQWETPDFGSPVKTRRGLAEQNAENTNLSFLFTLVPCDKKSLRHFANKVVMDADIFIDSFMSPALRKEFCMQRGIKLFWVDIGRYHQTESLIPNEEAGKSFDIVQQSLKTLGGGLLLFEALVTPPSLGPPAFSQISSSSKTSLRNQTQQSRQDIALVISNFAHSSLCHSLMTEKSTNTKSKIPLHHGGDSSMFNHMTVLSRATLIVEKGESRDVHLNLLSVLKDPEERNSRQVVANETSSVQASPYKGTIFEIKACMKRAHVRVLSPNIENSFLCEAQQDKASPAAYEIFQRLVGTIHQRQQSLILTVQSGGIAMPYLGVLEAVSPQTAQLTLLSFAQTLKLEKAMTLQQLAEDEKADLRPSSSSAALQEFVQKAVAAVGGRQHADERQKSQGVGEIRKSQFWPGLLEPWHQLASFRHMKCFLDSHSTSLKEMEHLSIAEESLLRRLQNVYQKEIKALAFPVLTQHNASVANASTITPQSVQTSGDRTHLSGDITTGSEDQSGLKRQSSLLARGHLMVSKAKQTPTLKLDDVDGDVPACISASLRPNATVFDSIDLKTIHDLKEYIHEQYNNTVSSSLGLETNVQALVNVTQHFMSQGMASSCAQEAAVAFLREKLLKTSADLRAHYESKTSQEDVRKKITEYKLQVLLRLEMECACASVDNHQTDQTTNEILGLLRALLFITDSGEVSHFMDTTVATNYVSSIPGILVNLYDELMQPLPPALAGFGSPQTAASVAPEPLSVGSQQSNISSVQPDSAQSQSSQPARTRSLRLHPSLSDLGTRRQIVIEAKPQQKSKVVSKEKEGDKASKSKGKGDKKGPRRNLFESALRQKKEKQDSPFSLESNRRSSPRKKVLKTETSPYSRKGKALVVETPARQQHSRAVWLQQQRERQRSNLDAQNAHVVAESPVKEVTKTSPGLLKPVRRVLRKAFYSAGHVNRSRSLARAEELSACIAGRRHLGKGIAGGRLSDVLINDRDMRKTPTQQALPFLLTQLMKSPSPGPVTPTRVVGPKPDCSTPSQNTRSKHLRDSSPILSDGDEPPALFSSRVVSALDFTSPVKQAGALLIPETPRRTRGRELCIAPNRKSKRERSGSTAGSPEQIVRVFDLHSPHRDLRRTHIFLTSPTKAESDVLHAGLDKAQALVAGSTVPTKQGMQIIKELPHITSNRSGASERGLEDIASGSGHPQLLASAHCSRKRIRQERSPGMQSSILAFVSPTQRPQNEILGRGLEDVQMTRPVLDCTTSPRQSSSSSTRGVAALPRKLQSPSKLTRASSSGTSERKRALEEASPRKNISPVKTPSKAGVDEQFLSPSKTPVRSILKNSPLLQRSLTPTTVRTPSKSPRVTFDMKIEKGEKQARTPSPARRLVKTPDSLDKWPRRKRRWTSDSSKSSSSSPFSSSSGNDDMSVDSLSTQSSGKTLSGVTRAVGSASKNTAYVVSVDTETNNPLVCKIRQRSSHMLRDISSPRKKCRTENSEDGSLLSSRSQQYDVVSVMSVDNGAENSVMDFSLGSNDVFFPLLSRAASSARVKRPSSKRVQSPEFKSQSSARTERGLWQYQPSFGDGSSQGFGDGSSQGFDVSMTHGSSCAPLSPVFSSPVSLLKHSHHSEVGASRQCTSTTNKGDAELHAKKRLSSENALTTEGSGDGCRGEKKEKEALVEASSRKLTPLRIKGTQTNMKFSPGVSTSSLVHLMNSPILFGSQKKRERSTDAMERRKSGKLRSRKALQL